MFNQHAKWLKVTSGLPWRRKIASLNYMLASHVWRQDHNGFTHQDPGFIDHVVNKKAEVVRVYLPPDANRLLSVMDHRQIWGGDDAHVLAAQRALYHRASCNRAARRGEYTAAMEIGLRLGTIGVARQ
jgi:phosphoketolase